MHVQLLSMRPSVVYLTLPVCLVELYIKQSSCKPLPLPVLMCVGLRAAH